MKESSFLDENKSINDLSLLPNTNSHTSKNPKEDQVKENIQKYFNEHQSLTLQNFDNFLEYIGLKEIWSSEEEQTILWESIKSYAVDKQNIDYNSALNGIIDLFNEDDDDQINDLLLGEDCNNDINENNKSIDKNNSCDNNNKINNNELEDINDENKIKEFLDTIKLQQDYLYQIKFINDIFFESNNNNIAMKISEIYSELKTKYKFINSNNDTIKNYLNLLKNDKNNEENVSLKKNILENINSIINKNINENNFNKNYLYNSKINTNTYSIEEYINILKDLDDKINNSLNSMLLLNNNKNFLELLKDYIQNYIHNLKQDIYYSLNDIEKKYNQTKKNNENGKQDKNNSSNLLWKNFSSSINDYTERKNSWTGTSVSQPNKNKSSSKKQYSNNIILKNKNPNNKIYIPPISLSNIFKSTLNIKNSSKNHYDNFHKNENKNQSNLEQFKYCDNSSKKSQTEKSPSKAILNLHLIKNDTTSSLGEFYDTITNSRLDLFNSSCSSEQFLIDTTRLMNEDINIDNIGSTTPNKQLFDPNDLDLDFEDIDTFQNNKNKNANMHIDTKKYNIPNIDINTNLNSNNSYSNGCNSNNNALSNSTTYYNNLFPSNNKVNNTLNLMFDSKNNLISNIRRNSRNEDKFYEYVNRAVINFYDFNYLSDKLITKKLLAKYNDRIIHELFYSSDVLVMFNKLKKHKSIFIISSKNFYFFKPDLEMSLLFNISIKLLDSVTIASKNFNLLLLSFKNGTDIIIESSQRMEILFFLKKIINTNLINMASSNNFCIRKKNGKTESVRTKENKNFNLTPNFENAQKIGYLLKYQENFFKASFTKKFVVLCSIGLICFDNDIKKPKIIIPIIGTLIQFIVIRITEKIYCFKMKTINNDEYIFGSINQKEIFDWLKELALFKQTYHMKMKEISPNFVLKPRTSNGSNEDD